MQYTTQTAVSGEFDEVVDKTVEALEHEGFGVLADIDVRATFEQKLGEEFRRYRILGACNPGLAREGLAEDLELGALLPCNVVVYETDDGSVTVSAVDPGQLLGIADDPALDELGTEVADRFDRVLSTVADEFEAAPEA